jgi:hypothetical protein
MTENLNRESRSGPDVRIEVEPHDGDQAVQERISKDLIGLRVVRDLLQEDNLRVESFHVWDKEPGDDSTFDAIVYAPETCRSVHVIGQLGALDRAKVEPSAYRPRPTAAEFASAVQAVQRDARLSQIIERGDLKPYPPMPPFADIEHPDGTVERVVTVGLWNEPEDRHQILGVLTDGTIIQHPEGVPPPGSKSCGPKLGEKCQPPDGRRQVRVRVFQGDVLLWDFVVVRPHASSGINGSGVELLFVDYRGKRVLSRAHVPILNVEYGAAGFQAGCGPTYRDWLRDEVCFHAMGNDPAGSGFRVCTSPPQTILDSGADGGNFAGVALWYDGSSLELVSQLSAGWYRYASEWHLENDGTIKPRFGFAAATNPCTCDPHTHHAYWRFDFDINLLNDVVEEFNDPPIVGKANWHTKTFEIRRPRDPSHQRHWRVRDKGSSRGYTIVPGPSDGTTDPFSPVASILPLYGAGDFWALRQHGSEIDDGQGFTKDIVFSQARISSFLSGELINGTDIVVWYGAHFIHDEAHPSPSPHMVGPDLTPFGW